MYVPIHHGTLSATANSCTIDARRNTHPVSIRHILVLDGRKLLGFKLPKQALTNAFYYVLAGVSPTCLTPLGITLGATLPPTHGVRYCLSVYSPINKRTYIYSVSFSAMRYSPFTGLPNHTNTPPNRLRNPAIQPKVYHNVYQYIVETNSWLSVFLSIFFFPSLYSFLSLLVCAAKVWINFHICKF